MPGVLPATTTSARTWESLLRHPLIDGGLRNTADLEPSSARLCRTSISDEAAALLEPLSVAVTTMRKVSRLGSSILLAGAGPIGIICAQAARAFGAAEIIVTDLVPERRERALRLAPPAYSTLERPTSPTPAWMSTRSSTPAGHRTR